MTETGKISLLASHQHRDWGREPVREEKWCVNRRRQSSDVTRTQEMETDLELREIPGDRWTVPHRVKQ